MHVMVLAADRSTRIERSSKPFRTKQLLSCAIQSVSGNRLLYNRFDENARRSLEHNKSHFQSVLIVLFGYQFRSRRSFG